MRKFDGHHPGFQPAAGKVGEKLLCKAPGVDEEGVFLGTRDPFPNPLPDQLPDAQFFRAAGAIGGISPDA